MGLYASVTKVHLTLGNPICLGRDYEGVCRNHSGGKALTRKVVRTGYY